MKRSAGIEQGWAEFGWRGGFATIVPERTNDVWSDVTVNDTLIPMVEAPAKRCPRHARAEASASKPAAGTVGLRDLCAEPFRLFFPVAALAGLIGVGVWPVVLWGWTDNFPNVIHARLMIMGFFGGFVFGFLGTSIPRLLESRPFGAWETIPLVSLHFALTVCYALGATTWGDGLMLANLLLLGGVLFTRVRSRKDLPPPGFIMILPAIGCLITGLGLALHGSRQPLEAELELLFRLLTYHGFVLLSILGAGGFLLPRFLGTGIRQAPVAPGVWFRRVAATIGIGITIALSYALDVWERPQLGGTLRALLIVGYLWWQIPLERLRFSSAGVQWMLQCGLICLPVGILAAAWWPALRVSLGHVELVGGFSMITLGVATRVVFGHSGNRERLEKFHRWLTISGVLILLGVLSRIAGDIWPRLMLSHYLYGALCWMAGLVIWACCVLPQALKPDPEA